MNGALEILKRERDDAVEQIRTLRGRIRDLESAISVLEAQPTAPRAGRNSADLKTGVLAKLGQFGEHGATPRELADVFTQEGRATSDASVSSTLSRLKADGKVLNQGGRWFAADKAQPAAGSSLPPPPASSWEEDDDVPF